MTSPSSHLRIAATSDVHMHLVGWDALYDLPLTHRGMDRLANLIQRERASAQGGFVLFDNGDSLQGAPLGDICVNAPGDHPWAGILNALDYDAMGLGNHDFDFGLPYLEHVIAQLRCPTLCANVAAGAIAGAIPSTMIERSLPCSDGQKRRIQVGVTSVLPPQTAVWNRRCLDGALGFDQGVRATRYAVAALRDQGADVVIVLSHSGVTDGVDATGENFGATIAAEVPGVDAIILGHTHLRFPGADHAGFVGVDTDQATLHGVPAVMPAHTAQELGIIDLVLLHDGQGWHVSGHTVRRDGVRADAPPDPTVTTITAPFVTRTRAHLNRHVGTALTHMHNCFSMLRPSGSEALVARALTRTIADAIDDTDLAALPLLASIAPPALGGRAGPDAYVNIPPGPLRERHVAMLCPYPNTVWAAVLTGAELWDWIDRSMAFFAPGPAEGSALVNRDAPAFNFDTIHGIEATLDPFAQAAFDVHGHRVQHGTSRVQALTHSGKSVCPDARFVMAMTSYRGAGGGNFPGISPETRVVRTEVELRDAVRAEIADGLPQTNDPVTAPWHFAQANARRRVIRTSPMAEPFLPDIASFEPTLRGLDEDGFLRVEVTI
ncbi:MAG: 5'-nucleotidase C-terminal domain-containing protein [Pseudomonadota bacterium]